MDIARIAFAALATLGSGIALGLAAQPQMRTFPEQDWRARYRSAAPAAAPAPQPGVSYYGDGSNAWAFGGEPRRFADDLPPVRIPILREDYADWREPPLPEPAEYRDDSHDGASEAERAAAQAIVADALSRSNPADPDANPAPDAGQEPDPAGLIPVLAPAQQPSPDGHSASS